MKMRVFMYYFYDLKDDRPVCGIGAEISHFYMVDEIERNYGSDNIFNLKVRQIPWKSAELDMKTGEITYRNVSRPPIGGSK